MSTIEHAVIAVAGLGSRLGRGVPKCLVQVAGKSIIRHQLELVKNIADVRIVVGNREHEVISQALSIRSDLTIVRNPDYRATTTQQSYWLGSRYLAGRCLYLDGDIVFEPSSFEAFLNQASGSKALIGVTDTKTSQPVYTEVVETTGTLSTKVLSFSRTQPSEWEWANIAYLPTTMLEENGGNVFQRLERFLPLDAAKIDCYEIDTEEDFEKAEVFARKLVGVPR